MMAIILILMLVYSFVVKKLVLKNKLDHFYYRDIPSNDPAAYVGKIVKGHANGNDLISTILELIYKGYIRVQEENNKRVLYLQKDYKTIDLKEHELFLIKQIFKNNNRVVFEDYVKSKKFKNDFKTFDTMLDRRIEMKKEYKESTIKNISKIVFLTVFSILGISIAYSILIPFIYTLIPVIISNKIITCLVMSVFIHLIVIYKYILYISKSTNAKENINLSITYIILFIIIGCVLGFSGIEKILSILNSEIVWYKIIINCIMALVVLLYGLNIIKHTEKKEYMFYGFCIISIISILFNMQLLMCICIVFFSIHIFFKAPKHYNLTEDDYIYKWIAFKNYLEDYSLLSEQEENAMLIWEKYLIYAVSLGINKKIIKKYANLSNTILLSEQGLKRFYIEYLE